MLTPLNKAKGECFVVKRLHLLYVELDCVIWFLFLSASQSLEHVTMMMQSNYQEKTFSWQMTVTRKKNSDYKISNNKWLNTAWQCMCTLHALKNQTNI